MKELRELEALIVKEVSQKRGSEVSTIDPTVIGTTIGTLYGIILGHKSALDEMNKVIANKREELTK